MYVYRTFILGTPGIKETVGAGGKIVMVRESKKIPKVVDIWYESPSVLPEMDQKTTFFVIKTGVPFPSDGSCEHIHSLEVDGEIAHIYREVK